MYGDEFIKVVATRKSIRKWNNVPVPQKLIEKILSAGLSAPSAYGASPWEFIIITSSKMIKELLSDRYQLKEHPYYINSISEATKQGMEKFTSVSLPPLLIAACGNLEKCPDKISTIQSVSCACENILLTSHALDLGACWLYVYDPKTPQTEERIKKLLNIPDHILVLSLLAIGFTNEKSSQVHIYKKDKIHENKW